MAKMKMWVGNLDGHRAGLVIASSKDRARRVVGTSRGDFDAHWTPQPVAARLTPEVLYTRPLRYEIPQEPWQQGRCAIK